MIVDGHLHITDVPEPVWGWPAFDGPDLIKIMDNEMPVFGRPRKIEYGAVMPALGTTTRHDITLREQHAVVIRAVRANPGRLVGTYVLNPRLGVQEGIDELRYLVANENFRMVKLHPTMHNYWPHTEAFVGPVLEEAVALNIPVLMHMGEPPYSIPALVEPIAENHPKATIILAHLATQKICYADDAVNVARHCENILLETGWGVLPRLLEAARALGPTRLVFGSDSPPMEPFGQLRVVECLAWDPPLGVRWTEAQVEQVMGDNLGAMLKLGKYA
jgi:predicted TIM-barrel fold metal-dependent hydrolase